MNQRILNIGKAILGILLLAWLVSKIDYTNLQQTLASGNCKYFIIGLLFYITVFIFEFLKLFALVYPTINCLKTIKIIYIASFLNNFLPSNIGGDTYKVAALNKESDNWLKWLTLVITDRVIGLSLLVTISILLMLIHPTKLWDPFKKLCGLQTLLFNNILFIVYCFMLLIICIYWYRKHLYNLFRLLSTKLGDVRPRQYAIALGCSTMFHLCRLGAIYSFLLALGDNTALEKIIITMSFTAIASILPLSLGALGIREGAFTIILGTYGVDYTTAISVAMLVRVLLWGQAVAGGIIMMADKKQTRT